MRGLVAKSFLHLFPDRSVYDCLMLAGMPNLAVPNLAEIDGVGEQFVERTATEQLSSRFDPFPGNPDLRDDPVAGQFFLEQADRAEFQIPFEDVTDCHGFRFVDHQTPLAPVIAERYRTPHPKAALLGGGNLVANALAGHLTLELCEREQHIQREPTHRGRGVELLSHRHERHARGRRRLRPSSRSRPTIGSNDQLCRPPPHR